jgi:hypothetical protein
MNEIKTILAIFCILCLLGCCVQGALASDQAESPVCMFYFTGIGCPHCKNVDPVIFGDWLEEYPDLIVVEYEIYEHTENVPIFQTFVTQLNISPGVPNLVMGINGSVAGDTKILDMVPAVMDQRANITAEFGNVFFTLDRCKFAALTGSPQIWHDNRILIKTGPDESDDVFLKELLLTDDLYTTLRGTEYEEVDPVPVNFSGGAAEFEHAIQTGNWTLQWNGEELKAPETPTASTPLALGLGIAAVGAVALARRKD